MDRRCQKTGAAIVEPAQPAAVAGATRVRYRERQLLRSTDLAAEQAYHLAMHRRHNIAHHTWGIVRGLEIVQADDARRVEPGVAVDGYGRELFITESLVIPEDSFDRLESEALDVWLVYDRVEETTPLRGRWECGPGRHNRWRELSRLRLTPARSQTNPHAPAEVPEDDLLFAPYRTPPDDPAKEWPVYLGTIIRTPPAQPRAEPPRPSAQLVGEMLNAPSGRARMQVGGELASDTKRFSVGVPDATGAFIERLSIDRDGKTTVRGDAALGGDLTFHESELPSASAQIPADHCARTPTRAGEEAAARSLIFRPAAATPAEAAPWQVYRTTLTENERQVRQLRFELGHPGDEGDPRLNKLAVGTSDAGGDFTACLTVTADCLVTIAGDLEVTGRIIEGPVKADPTDPRFSAELLNQWSRGVASADSQLGNIFNGGVSDLVVTAQSDDQIMVGGTLEYTIEVTNNGLSAITNGQLYVNVAYMDTSDNVIYSERKTSGPFNLAGGAVSDFEFTYGGPTGTPGEIHIAVTVIGVGPLSNVLSAKFEKIVTVFEPIP